jgi:hypothetical protein
MSKGINMSVNVNVNEYIACDNGELTNDYQSTHTGVSNKR